MSEALIRRAEAALMTIGAAAMLAAGVMWVAAAFVGPWFMVVPLALSGMGACWVAGMFWREAVSLWRAR